VNNLPKALTRKRKGKTRPLNTGLRVISDILLAVYGDPEGESSVQCEILSGEQQ